MRKAVLARHMPRDWTHPQGSEALDLSMFGDAIYSEGDTFPVLSHPLYHQVLHHPALHGWANKALASKLDMLRRYAWHPDTMYSVVWLYERPYRCRFLYHLWCWKEGQDQDSPAGFPDSHRDVAIRLWELFMEDYQVRPDRFWELARDTWVDNENIHQELDAWGDMWFDPDSRSGDLWMGEENKDMALRLPKKVELWRGECDDGGWSYSLRKDVGEFFANRGINRATGEVVHLQVPKDLVFAFIGDRNEEEVILLESDLSEYEINRYRVKNAA